MPECESTHLLGQSAFAFAIRPFNPNFVDDHRDLLSLWSTQSALTYVAPPAVLQCSTSEKEMAIMYSVAEPRRRYSAAELRPAKSLRTYVPIASLRRQQVQTMLMRCQVLYATLQSTTHRSSGGGRDCEGVRYTEDMRLVVYKARQLAEGLQDVGLQARCEFWAGRVCLNGKDEAAAMGHFKRAISLDVSMASSRVATGRSAGLRPIERQVIDTIMHEGTDHEIASAMDFTTLESVVKTHRVFSAGEKMSRHDVELDSRESPSQPRIRPAPRHSWGIGSIEMPSLTLSDDERPMGYPGASEDESLALLDLYEEDV